MAKFKYSAIFPDGKQRKGSIEAMDKEMATTALRQQGLFVATISEAGGLSGSGGFKEFIGRNTSPKNRDLVFFFKQLSFMLRAGLPVVQALEIAVNQFTGRLHYAIKDMIVEIQNGTPLSRSMRNQKLVFPSIAVNLMLAAESTGGLEAVSQRIATYLEKKAALKSQTITAMIYPTILLLVSIAVVTFLVWKIIPQFGKFLAAKGKALPASTQFLLDASDFAVKNGLYIFGGLVLIIVALVSYYMTQAGRLNLDRLALKIPVIGKLLMNAAMAEFTWSLAMMLRSGVTVYDSLKTCVNVIANRFISNKISYASEQILGGRELSQSLKGKEIPDLVVQMTTVGEKTGTLDQTLQELGIFYEERLEESVKRLTALIEPMMILIMGGLVGFVYYAFFQALFALTGKGG
ncbi:MAG: type II secretion system F family protein [Methylophilus sp.]|nr:type II secretion system F family protein [Methylophilus sp.]